MFKRLALLVLSFVCVFHAAHAQETTDKPSSLLEGRVTFALPTEWGVKNYRSTTIQASARLDVPKLNPKAEPPIATLNAHTVGGGIGVRHLSDGVYKNGFEGLAMLSDTFDGEEWRTMVWTAKSATPYLALQRFGVVGGVAVELTLVFHLPEGGDLKAAEKTVAQFNSMCESLKVDGKNKFTNRVELARFADKLKAVK